MFYNRLPDTTNEGSQKDKRLTKVHDRRQSDSLILTRWTMSRDPRAHFTGQQRRSEALHDGQLLVLKGLQRIQQPAAD